VDNLEIRRRLRAARALAKPTKDELRDGDPDPSRGITVVELAARVQDEWPVSAKTLGAIERGEREARPMELRTIAAACDLPYEFFTADLNATLAGAPSINGGRGDIDVLFNRLAALLELAEDEERTLDRRRRTSAKRSAASARGPRKR
jgi:hypothetical protein